MKREDIHQVVQTILEAALPEIPVFVDLGEDAIHKAMVEMLGSSDNPTGVCLAISPILGSQRVDSYDTALVERCSLTVHLRENPAIMPVNHFETVSKVIAALLTANENDQRDRLEFEQEVTRLVPEDTGNLTTAISFSVCIHT